MRNQHCLKTFRDFPTFFRTCLGSSGTYPGVQNRSLGATFVKFSKNSKFGPKAPGAHRAHGPRPLGPIGPIFVLSKCYSFSFNKNSAVLTVSFETLQLLSPNEKYRTNYFWRGSVISSYGPCGHFGCDSLFETGVKHRGN